MPTTVNFMKFVSTIVIAVGLTPAAGVNAQKIDFSQMTCAGFLQSDKNTSTLIITWFSGYYTEEKDPQVLDLSALDDLQEKFVKLCELEPTFYVSTAAEGIFGQ